jgi:predicted NBD/HSP70 family sugar kinase
VNLQPAPGLAASAGQLLALLRAEPDGYSRSTLLRLTGMARSTLHERLDALFAAGLVYEADALRSTGGRPARRIRFDDRDKVVAAFDVGQSHAAVHLLTLRHRVLASERIPFALGDPADDAVDRLVAAARRLADGRAPVGAGLGLPAPVDATGARGFRTSVLADWDVKRSAARLEDALGCPVVLENDARAMAAGEADGTSDTLVAVKVSTGIGCGIVVDGALVRGIHGVAGDIGHIQIPEAAGRLCRCGRTGCLAAVASGRALLADPRVQGCASFADLARAHDAGDPGVLEAVAEAGRLTGTVLAAVVATINPARLALGGAVGSLAAFIDAVRASVAERTFGDALVGLDIGAARRADPIPVGLSLLVEQTLYEPGRVDLILASGAGPGTRGADADPT